MNDLHRLLDSVLFRLERLESNVRRNEAQLGELLKDSSVLNRKVETLHDETQTNSFLKEEDPDERAWNAHPAVQSLSQADA